jgi:hypothetical protein
VWREQVVISAQVGWGEGGATTGLSIAGKMFAEKVVISTQVGWGRGASPLLTVETEVNGDLKRTNERRSLIGLLVCRAGTRDFCYAWAALVGPVPKFFHHHYIISVHLSPSTSKAGQEVLQGRLSPTICLWSCIAGRNNPQR